MKGLTGKARLAGVMGWPVAHSRSPLIHGYWLKLYNIDGAYLPLAVEPRHLQEALKALPHLGFRGVNLTVPHKVMALDVLDHVDPLAKRMGAANTIIVREDGTLEGRNTDGFGFVENLNAAGFSFSAQNNRAVILGAGGAARAIAVALQDKGFKDFCIINRDPERAKSLASALGVPAQIFSWDQTKEALENATLLVNTTSLGMTGQPPLTLDLAPLPPSAFVADVVYAPLETELLKQARRRGLPTADGLGMLLYQARGGFEAWFGQAPVVTQELYDLVVHDLSKAEI
ncbi:MAG: shikimate dehydrogenase [Alphaproteobacteria bacterium]|nr:shikimate dehydrogenase [Alphaproteobacteria bacterium]